MNKKKTSQNESKCGSSENSEVDDIINLSEIKKMCPSMEKRDKLKLEIIYKYLRYNFHYNILKKWQEMEIENLFRKLIEKLESELDKNKSLQKY